MAGHRSNGAGLQFPFSSVRFAFPGFLDFGICIKASDEPLKEVRPICRCELQDFGFQGFEMGTHVDLPGRLTPDKAQLATTRSGVCQWAASQRRIRSLTTGRGARNAQPINIPRR